MSRRFLVKKSLSYFLTAGVVNSVLRKIRSQTISSWKWRKNFYADVVRNNGEFYGLVNGFPVSSWRNWHPCLFLKHPNIFRPPALHWHDPSISPHRVSPLMSPFTLRVRCTCNPSKYVLAFSASSHPIFFHYVWYKSNILRKRSIWNINSHIFCCYNKFCELKEENDMKVWFYLKAEKIYKIQN